MNTETRKLSFTGHRTNIDLNVIIERVTVTAHAGQKEYSFVVSCPELDHTKSFKTMAEAQALASKMLFGEMHDIYDLVVQSLDAEFFLKRMNGVDA
jgi:hypothetical protein